MKNPILIITPFFLLIYSCGNRIPGGSISQWKREILKTEQDFAVMAKEKGIRVAFLSFAADDAVLNRNNELVSGKIAISNFYSDVDDENVSLSWKPDFVDVSASGDLGYTYGHYAYVRTDSTGHPSLSEGIFHTVWKRQPDGSWKFVWD